MHFAFSWELPAAIIGGAAVFVAAGAAVVAIARAHHGPSHLELVLLGMLVIAGLGAWNTRDVLAQRFFPDDTGVIEEGIALQLLTYGDCAAFAARTGHGEEKDGVCTVRVFSARGRFVASSAPRKSFESPCDLTPNPEVRVWTFRAGSLRDWCAR